MQAELPFEVPCVINGKEVSCSFWSFPPLQPCPPPSRQSSECPKNVVAVDNSDFLPRRRAWASVRAGSEGGNEQGLRDSR
jgi:hypothetical protein